MTTDARLLEVYLRAGGDANKRRAYRAVCRAFNTTPATVRGRIRRERQRRLSMVELNTAQIKEVQHGSLPGLSTMKAQKIIDAGHAVVAEHRARIQKLKRPYRAVFLSDIHFPFADDRALAVTYKLLSDLPDVFWISALNDALTLDQYSTFSDSNDLNTMLPNTDLGTTFRAHGLHMATLKAVAPRALFPAVYGNHELRIDNIADNTRPTQILLFMRTMQAQGVQLLSMPVKAPDGLNAFVVTPAHARHPLIWFHGATSSVNAANHLKKDRTMLKGRLQLHRDFSYIRAHSHAHAVHYDEHGVCYNAGCLCQIPQPWSPKYPTSWTLGGYVATLWPDGKHETVPFRIDKEDYTCIFNGKRYSA